MLHTVALQLETDDNICEYILCTCGELFRTNVEPDWEWSVVLMAAHLKEVNAPKPISLDDLQDQDTGFRGNNDLKPVKPSGDDPRSGYIQKKKVTKFWDRFDKRHGRKGFDG